MILHALVAAAVCQVQPKLPEVVVSRDDTVISESCRVKIDAAVPIADANGNGVIQIGADDITVEFAPGSALRGAAQDGAADEFTGTGVRVQGRKGVTLRGLAVSGYKVGVWATGAEGLTVERCDLSGNYRQHLRSTAVAEQEGDWLYPHHNDENEWAKNYGAALYVEDSSGVTVKDVVVRRGQNGIVLDGVIDSKVFDNDCSFLSGWGLAMWRSSRNIVTRNAFDFCVRGYSHGVYNRGQDSAGILMFEQCSGNTIAENSATHGGDCIFGFAGSEAIGETKTPGLDLTRRGNNDNLFINNDLSYAPAHGLEMTFSFGNKVIGNKFIENAICGIWGGYSQDTLIAKNTFDGNGGMAYGLERGGINIEHSAGNQVLGNTFKGNKCGVHLWWDNDETLLKGPWGRANAKGVAGNVIAGNTFDGDELVLQLRDDGTGNLHDNLFVGNRMIKVIKEMDVKSGSEPSTKGQIPKYQIPRYEAVGRKKPVGARAKLKGRENIVMTEWGPWDHESPLARLVSTAAAKHVYEVFGAGPDLKAAAASGDIQVSVEPAKGEGPAKVIIEAKPGVTAYAVNLTGKGFKQTVAGTIVSAKWTVRFFPWKVDPREDRDGWLQESRAPEAVEATADAIRFGFGGGGPRETGLSEAVKEKGPGPDHFGTLAWTTIPLAKGTWRITTLSDDGIRVRANGANVIENWTWHAPAKDTGEFTQAADGDVFIYLEHFEIDGAAALTLDLERVD